MVGVVAVAIAVIITITAKEWAESAGKMNKRPKQTDKLLRERVNNVFVYK